MRFRRKEKAPVDNIPQGPAPYDIGLTGTLEELEAAICAAEKSRAEKEKAYSDYDRKSDGGMKMRYSLQKYFNLYEAYLEAPDADHVKHNFYQGAVDAFLQGRPDNFQHILSHREDFSNISDDTIFVTLCKLISNSDSPDTVSDIALAQVTKEDKQNILDRTLDYLVSNHTDIKKTAEVLLRSGADIHYNSGMILAIAFHRGVPADVIDLFLKHGATFEESLQRMEQNPDYYGDTKNKLMLVLQDQRIKELEKTVEELTGKKKSVPTPSLLKTNQKTLFLRRAP